MKRDEWRDKVSPGSGLDCVLLDAVLFDADAKPNANLVLVRVMVREADTRVVFGYGDRMFDVRFSGGEETGEGSFKCVTGVVKGSRFSDASVSLVLSSHAYIRSVLGDGEWDINVPVLDSRVVRVSDGMGVNGISVNGSEGVSGHDSASEATGDVILEEGYRTSPIIYGGKVFVRVGRRYGYDPCKFDFGDAGSRDCRRPLFFFCGQNAVNNGNIVLRGGKGISVSQGGSYTVRDSKSKCDGMTIPCVEIVASRELLDICRPEDSEVS
jgi:hypothetical protein